MCEKPGSLRSPLKGSGVLQRNLERGTGGTIVNIWNEGMEEASGERSWDSNLSRTPNDQKEARRASGTE